jgi:hypothetical protein
MSKEKVLNEKLLEASLTLSHNEYKIMLSAMQEYADQEKEKAAVAFLDSIRDYERESEKSICYDDRSSSDLYQYFITNVYNK